MLDLKGYNDRKKCLIILKKNRYIPGILPNNKKIEKNMILNLTDREIRRCMNNSALVYIADDNDKFKLDETNFWFDDFQFEDFDHPPIAMMGSMMIGFNQIY